MPDQEQLGKTHSALRWEMRTRGLVKLEAKALCSHLHYQDIIARHDEWRATHGFPAKDSPLARGHLMTLVRTK